MKDGYGFEDPEDEDNIGLRVDDDETHDIGTFTATAVPSNVSTLRGLSVSPGVMDPAEFDAAVTAYAVKVGYTITLTRVTAAATSSAATVTITAGENEESGTGSASMDVELEVGAATVTIAVESEDESTTTTYTPHGDAGRERAKCSAEPGGRIHRYPVTDFDPGDAPESLWSYWL